MADDYRRIELITGEALRRHWSTEHKLQIIEESFLPGETVSSVARRRGVAPNLLYRWRLRDEHGFCGGYTVVKDYVRIARARGRETFVPLSHPPGHAQVDFGEVIGVIGGVRCKIHFFCMTCRIRTPAL